MKLANGAVLLRVIERETSTEKQGYLGPAFLFGYDISNRVDMRHLSLWGQVVYLCYLLLFQLQPRIFPVGDQGLIEIRARELYQFLVGQIAAAPCIAGHDDFLFLWQDVRP
jgi:hypothetical protein